MLTKCGDNSYEVSGELSIADLCDALELPESRIVTECTSVGGWLTELAGHIAEEGESVSGDWFRMTVLQMQEQRVQRILLELTEPDPDAEHENAAVEAAVSGG